MRGRALFLVAAVWSTDALSLNNGGHESMGTLRCDDKVMALDGDVAWGIWIDGRDAYKGPNVYGEKYCPDMRGRLDSVYKHLEQKTREGNEPGLRLKDWHVAAKDRALRNYPNPVSNEVRVCHKNVYNHTQRGEIFKGIDVIGRGYGDIHDSSYDSAIKELIRKYNFKMDHARGRPEQLHALSYLMRNLAYMHPLSDKNGRTRMLLTQFELRRNGIACGTMMYNNNKDIYFQTEQEFADKLEEGIEMYEMAAKTHKNPWHADKDSVKRHDERFPNPLKSKMTKCWHNFCNYDKHDHSVQGHAACTGTRIALDRKASLSRMSDETVDEEEGNLEFVLSEYHNQTLEA